MDSTGLNSNQFETTAVELEELNQAFNASRFTEHDPLEHFGDSEPVENVLDGSEYASIRATIENRIDPPISVPTNEVIPTEDDRPHNKLDDSSDSTSGSRQATTAQLLTLKSISWAEKMVGFRNENASQTRTAVSKH